MAQHHNLLTGPANIQSTRSESIANLNQYDYDGQSTQKRVDKRFQPFYMAIIALLLLAVGLLTGLLINELTTGKHTKYIYITLAPTYPTKQELLVPPTTAPTTSPTSPPTADPNLAFLPDSTIGPILSDTSSPQARAWDWLLEHPDYEDMTTWRKRQLMGLVTTYYATGGNAYWAMDAEAAWLDASLHECEWPLEHSDEDCSIEGEYRTLTLTTHGLVGSLPPEIGFLTSLNELNIWDNGELQGTLPTQLGDLTALTHLAVINSKLDGSLPSQIGRLTALTYLALNKNRLSGSLPTTLGALTALTWLSLWENRFGGSVPVEMWGLWDLAHLFLYNNTLTGTIPQFILRMTSLMSLGLYENQLEGSLPTALGELTALTWLSVSDNKLTGAIPDALGELTALTWLSFRNNQLAGKVPRALGSLQDLRALIVSNNDLYGWLPISICELPELQFLMVDCASVTCVEDCSTQCGCD